MNHIAYYRNKNSMTQRELASKLNVSNGAVAMWETNQRNPSIKTAKKIAKIFNVSIEKIFNDDSDNESLDKTG